MVYLKTKVDTSKAERKFRRLLQQVDREGKATINDLVGLGKNFAKSIVPVCTGRTYQFIISRTGTDAKGPFGRVIARNPTASDGHLRKISNFNLVRWMHTSGKAQNHIKSGDRKFMYTTRDYLNGIKKKTATGRYKRINIR